MRSLDELLLDLTPYPTPRPVPLKGELVNAVPVTSEGGASGTVVLHRSRAGSSIDLACGELVAKGLKLTPLGVFSFTRAMAGGLLSVVGRVRSLGGGFEARVEIRPVNDQGILKPGGDSFAGRVRIA